MKSSAHGLSFQFFKNRPYLGIFGQRSAFMVSFLLKAASESGHKSNSQKLRGQHTNTLTQNLPSQIEAQPSTLQASSPSMNIYGACISQQRRRWHPTPVLLPGESHGWRSLVGCSPWGCEESDTTERLPFHFSLSCIGEGNGNPLQCSRLENPRDRGAWWATVYGVTQSRT